MPLLAEAAVVFALQGFGSEKDMHSPTFPGQTVTYSGSSIYALGVMPSNTYVLEMLANGPGVWQYYCNTLDHVDKGMRQRLQVS